MIEWLFIIAILSVLGFGPFFISLVKILFRDAFVMLTVNGSQSQSISLARSVR